MSIDCDEHTLYMDQGTFHSRYYRYFGGSARCAALRRTSCFGGLLLWGCCGRSLCNLQSAGKKTFTVRINVTTGWFTSAKGKPGEEIQGYAPDHFWVGIYEDHERGASNYLHYQYADAQVGSRSRRPRSPTVPSFARLAQTLI